jgi:hypothetical protein
VRANPPYCSKNLPETILVRITVSGDAFLDFCADNEQTNRLEYFEDTPKVI